MKFWQTSLRKIPLERPLVMAILNVTPDSFSDGGAYLSIDDALRQAEKLIGEGADILDIGGESTRPGGVRVSVDEEMRRVGPVISEIAKRFDTPLSIDASKSSVAAYAVSAGAEIINDISGLRFDAHLAHIAAESRAGLVLMHSRGTFETMHSEPPVGDIFAEVFADFRRSIDAARSSGVANANIVLDPGIGFGKTFEQNLELLAKLDKIADEFKSYPILIGASRKSFIGKVLGNVPTSGRVLGSVEAALAAIKNGAAIVRVHDVKETVAAFEAASVTERQQRNSGQ